MTMNVILRAEALRTFKIGQISELQAEVASLDRFLLQAEELSHDSYEPLERAQTVPATVSSEVVTPLAVASVAAEERPAEASSAPIPEPTVEARVTIRSRVYDFVRANPDTTREEIAAALEISSGSVSGHLSALNLKGIRQNRNVRFSDKLRALLAEHPNYDTQQAAEALGVDTSTVTSTARTCGIEIKRVGTDKFRKLIQEGRSKPAAPTPPPEPETLPDEPYSPPVVPSKPGKQFWLTDGQGNYLHFACQTMVSGKSFRWSGTQDQIAGCKRHYKIAADLVARAVL